jgi:pimeloyl-ACP methyl ester carboxylesterase
MTNTDEPASSAPLVVKMMFVSCATLCFSFMGAASARVVDDRSEVVEAGGASIHISIRGTGKPIIFIPSLARGVEDFDDLSRRLADAGYQAILPDPRGIGASKGPLDGITLHDLAADVAAVIRARGGSPAVLIGHGFGNRVARMVASDYPKLTSRVIILAAGGKVPETSQTLRDENLVFDANVPEAERLAAMRRVFFARGNDDKAWQKGWHLEVAPAQLAIMARQPLQDWWSGGSAPILVLQATEDIQAVPENSKLLAREFPSRVMVVEIDHAGHAMLPEQPERISVAILRYLGPSH